MESVGKVPPNLMFIKAIPLSEGRETQILKFNSPPPHPPPPHPTPPYTLSLRSPSYSKLSQLSYEPSCSHELWCTKCAM